MSLENWVKNSWLERRDSDAVEIARLLALADGRLEDYRRAVAGKLSSDVQLGLAYDAMRISATAALRAAGYRVVRGGSEHYRTIEALEFSIDPQKKIIPTLDMATYNPGDHVKVEFAGGPSGESEWMWVKVRKSDDEHRILFGKLDSQPVVHTELKVGQELAVSYDQIREHRRFAGE